MRGPHDDQIAAQTLVPEAAGAATPRRPPGGKVLVRLLQLLDSAGLVEAAERAVDAAVGGNGQRRTLEALRPRHRDRAAAAPAAVGAAPSTEEVARTYAEAAERLAAAPAAGVPAWRSLGPVTIPNGQTYGTSRVNVSGRIAAIAVDPSDPAHVLVGAANGGVWESRDRGATWAPRTDAAATLTTGALAFDPSDPDTVLCGTGEGNWWSYLGVGILRSSDGGTTWSTLCVAPFLGEGFYDLCFDPSSAGRLLAGTTAGLFSSTDGGATWTQRRTEMTWSVAAGSGEMLAGCSDGVRRSTDGGATWNAVSLPGDPGAFDRLAVAIAPSNPAVAYAWGASGGTAYLWRRRPSGTWAKVTPPAGVSTGQAWYDWFLAVAPDRDGQVYLGAIEAYRGDLSGTSWTWLCISNKGNTGQSIHPDQHAIAFEPGHPDTIYVGNDGGLFSSPDRGVAWQHRNNGLVISEFEYLAQDATSTSWLLGGLQDNGTARWTGSPTWDHVADGDGGDCAVNRSNPAVVWHTYYGMSPEVSQAHGDWNSWSYVPPPLPAGEGSPFYPPVEASLTSGDTFAIAGNALYLTRDNGAHWKRLAFPGGGSGSALAVPNGDSVWVATEDGRIFRTSWTGSTWQALAALASPRAAYISDLLVDSSGLTIWATVRAFGGGRVFVSSDGGATWTDRGAGLPPLPVNAIAVDPTDRNRLWVAADLGVYQTLDGGQLWAPYGTGLPNAYVGDLVLNPAGRLLRAGTRNRGVWEIGIDAAVATGPLHRYWNANIGDHFYTTNWAELGGGAHGWVYEGVQCHVFTTQQPGTVALHRYWNSQIGDHFYTTNFGELGGGGHGYHYEGVQCYVAPSPGTGTTPLHRYWNSQIGDHFYTTNFGELGGGGHGYHYEGIQCYVRTSAAPAAEPTAGEVAEAVPPTFALTGPAPAAAGAAGDLAHWSGVLGGGAPPEPPAWTATLGTPAAPGAAAEPPATFHYTGPPRRGGA